LVSGHAEGKNIALDVKRLADELVAGLRAWFTRLEHSNSRRRLRNVERNIKTLVRLQPKVERPTVAMPDGSVMTFEFRGLTTSSTLVLGSLPASHGTLALAGR